jgi:hypothetical protein
MVMIVATAQKHPHGYAAHELIPCTVGVSMSMKMPPATWTVFAPIILQSLGRDPDSAAAAPPDQWTPYNAV